MATTRESRPTQPHSLSVARVCGDALVCRSVARSSSSRLLFQMFTSKPQRTDSSVFLPTPVGFMTPEERKVFNDIRSPHLKYWIPMVWFANLASKARQEGRIQDSIDLQNILNVTQHCPNMNVSTLRDKYYTFDNINLTEACRGEQLAKRWTC